MATPEPRRSVQERMAAFQSNSGTNDASPRSSGRSSLQQLAVPSPLAVSAPALASSSAPSSPPAPAPTSMRSPASASTTLDFSKDSPPAPALTSVRSPASASARLDFSKTFDAAWTLPLSGGSLQHATWPMNPQWLISPSVDAADFTFVLTQAKHEGVDAIGMWIAVADTPEGRKMSMSDGQLITRSKFTHARHQKMDATLVRRNDGLPYILSVATDTPNIQGRFTLSLSSPNDYHFRITPIDSDDLPTRPSATQPTRACAPAAAYAPVPVLPSSVAVPAAAPAARPSMPPSAASSPPKKPTLKVSERAWFDAAESGDLATLAASVPPLGTMDAPDADGDTALIVAARCDRLETVQLLLKRKADPTIRNELGSTALHAAARGGHVGVARLLIGKCNVDSRDNAGHTPLHDSVWNCHDDMARLLVEAGASALITNKTGDTPLTTALKLGDPALSSMVQLLREAGVREASRAAARKQLLLRCGVVLLLMVVGVVLTAGQMFSTLPINTSVLHNTASDDTIALDIKSSFPLPAATLSEPRPRSSVMLSTLATSGSSLLLPAGILLAGAVALTAIAAKPVIVRKPMHCAEQPTGIVLL